MKLILEEAEISQALEDFVRKQFAVPSNQVITVKPRMGDEGLEGIVYLNATSAPIPVGPVLRQGGGPVDKPEPTTTVKKPRAAKPVAVTPVATVATHIAAVVAEHQEQADEMAAAEAVADAAESTDAPAEARGISTNPEDRQPPEEAAPAPVPAVNKNSIFAGLRAVSPAPTEAADPVPSTDDIAEAPAEEAPSAEPPKRSLFSFSKG